LKTLATTLLVPALLLAQGGPPFRSDDPDTPGNRHWEINTGFIGARNPFSGSYALPNIDINYGVGDRLQLKLEIPWSVQETRGASNHFVGGLGNSLLGIKYSFYQHHSKTRVRDGERDIKVSLSVYPQLALNNPTHSLARGVAEPGPQVLLPLEGNVSFRWIRISGEVGYRFSSKGEPNACIRGVVVGHEFRKDTELYLELYDQEDVGVINGVKKIRESTIGLGGRIPIVRRQWLRLIGMVGHGLVSPTQENGQPTWIAYVGIQFLSDRRRRHSPE